MELCPNAGGECLSSTCDRSRGYCWKQSQAEERKYAPPAPNHLYVSLAKQLDVPLQSICEGAGLKKETLQMLEKETGDDLSYASPGTVNKSINKFLNLKIDPTVVVTLYAHSDSIYERRDEPQFAGFSEEAFEALRGIVYEIELKVQIHRKTGKYLILSVNGFPVMAKA